nr:PqiC family protein [Marinifaba aquimaris]
MLDDESSTRGGYVHFEVLLPGYLQQDKLVVKEQEQLHFAHYHRWAEPLEKGIARYLSQYITIDANQSAAQVKVEVTKLHGSVTGQLFLSGRWQLTELKKNRQGDALTKTTSWRSFNYILNQAQAGYPAMVTAIEQSLNILAKDIEAELKSSQVSTPTI